MDLAAVARIGPGHHFDQRRFTGTILAHQRMHLAAVERESNIIERYDTRKNFPDAFHLKDRIVAHNIVCRLRDDPYPSVCSLISNNSFRWFVRLSTGKLIRLRYELGSIRRVEEFVR